MPIFQGGNRYLPQFGEFELWLYTTAVSEDLLICLYTLCHCAA